MGSCSMWVPSISQRRWSRPSSGAWHGNAQLQTRPEHAAACTTTLRLFCWGPVASCRSSLRPGMQVFNAAMLDFGRDWLEHAVRGPASIRNAVAGCADAAAGALATEYGVPCVDLGPYLADTKAVAAHEQAGGSHAAC